MGFSGGTERDLPGVAGTVWLKTGLEPSNGRWSGTQNGNPGWKEFIKSNRKIPIERGNADVASVVRQKGESTAYWFLGELFEVRVTGKDTGGKYSVIEITVPPGLPLGAPPHIHHDVDETVYVLEGTGRFHFDDRTVDAAAGAVLHFPRGTREWFENPGSSPLKIALMYSPAGIENFFAEVAEPARTRTVPPPPKSPPDLPKLVEVAKKYRLEIQAPPGR